MDDHSIKHYANVDVVKRHINQALKSYMSLKPAVENFNFMGGTVKKLVNLFGTIPIVFREKTYNIPVKIWILDTYPANPPLCYVTPTPNMKMNISTSLDHTGKVYHPYLHEWDPASCDLFTLIQCLIILFGDQLPVYDISDAGSNNQPNIPYPMRPSYYMPPMPTYGGVPGIDLPYPDPLRQRAAFGLPGTPPYPPQASLNHIPEYPSPQGHTAPYSQRPSSHYSPYPINSPFPQQMPVAGTGTITEEHIRASLLSAVEDKVRQNMKEQMAQWIAELETLEKIQKELTQGKDRISHLMTALEKEQSEWEKVLTTLRDKDLELETALLNVSNQGEIDVDEAVVTTAPLYKQLLNAFADEAATEDAIYYLGEALRRGVIDLDIFLKNVRSLSRKQFMLRALMNKCRNKAGLC